MAYHQNLHHIVFSTKNKKMTLTKEIRLKLFPAIGQTINHMNCKPILINGVEDHLHILCGVNPSVAIADLVQAIKRDAGSFIKKKFGNSEFNGWNIGYGCFSFSKRGLPGLCDYVASQEEHHAKVDFRTELIQLLIENDVEYKPEYLE